MKKIEVFYSWFRVKIDTLVSHWLVIFHIVSHMGITLTNIGSIINGFYIPRGKKFTDLGLRPRSVNFPPLGV